MQLGRVMGGVLCAVGAPRVWLTEAPGLHKAVWTGAGLAGVVAAIVFRLV